MGQVIDSTSVYDCLHKAAEAIGWAETKASPDSRMKGLAWPSR